MSAQKSSDPDQCVRENKETIVGVIKHSNDIFMIMFGGSYGVR